MRHLYIHVPFCGRRCSYCDFAIAVRRPVPSADFLHAIGEERRIRGGDGRWNDPLDTLYLGGGTPSRLTHDHVAGLVEGFSRVPHAEVTLEANPDDVTRAAAEAWVRAGVTRVSLGTQSFQEHVLEWMHRTHGGNATAAAVGTLRAAGIEQVSLDLIFGLPPELEHDWRADLETAVQLAPDHLSVYGLTVEPRTPLARWIARGRYRQPPDSRYEADFLLAHRLLTDAGFTHYEISNYARAGTLSRRARHNSAYWTGASYAGLGPAAHGFDGTTRRWNLREWAAYQRTVVAHGTDPKDGEEVLTPSARQLERVYLGLRTSAGVPQPEVSTGGATVRAAVERGWLVVEDGRLRATPAGWLRLDELIPRLTTLGEGG